MNISAFTIETIQRVEKTTKKNAYFSMQSSAAISLMVELWIERLIKILR